MRLFATLLVFSIAVSAQARGNHCDHNGGKVGGAIAGGIIGGVLGGLLGHGHTAPVGIGAVAGAVGGSALGDKDDDNKDWQECGTDSESFQRGVDRDIRREDEQADRDDRRADEIERDREMSRARRDRRPMYYQCQAIEGRHHHRIVEFVLVYLPTGRAVQHWGLDQYGCQRSERETNYSRY